jgi:isopentenyl diphosphate isomerase/L-lactate dehydrogenase-like FMN-dependent dehydrogenase
VSTPYVAAATSWVGPDELREQARSVLPGPIFDYVDSGADSEASVSANLAAFAAMRPRPRVLTDVSSRSSVTTVLGRPVPVPVLLAPTGQHRLYHPAGEIGVARAAAAVGTVAAMSTAGSTGIVDVAAAVPSARLWFQFYMPASRPAAEVMLGLAEQAEVEALCLTVDTPLPGFRERDVRNRMAFPPVVDPSDPVWAARPEWTAAYLAGPPPGQPNTAHLAAPSLVMNPALSWADVEWLRARWPKPLVLKAITRADDARRAAELGVDGIVVSNHGGRQLDTMPGTLECLPEVVAAVRDVPGRPGGGVPTVEVYLDGGVRRGLDVVKALALGARAVFIGRPYVWALAVGGSAAVEALLRSLADEVDRTLALLGCSDVVALDPSLFSVPWVTPGLR